MPMTAREALEAICHKASDLPQAIEIARETLSAIPPDLDHAELGGAVAAVAAVKSSAPPGSPGPALESAEQKLREHLSYSKERS